MKKIILLLVLIPFCSFGQIIKPYLTPNVITPEIEVYTGFLYPKPSNTDIGYMIGFNMTPNLHQKDKNPLKGDREWLNQMLFGFEFSGYNSKEQNFTVVGENAEQIVINNDCGCEETQLGGWRAAGNYKFNSTVRGFSLNFGVEIYRGWFLLGGLTGYRETLLLNDENIGSYQNVYFDGGLKKFIKIKKIYLSPTIKFNSKTTSFGVGFSFD